VGGVRERHEGRQGELRHAQYPGTMHGFHNNSTPRLSPQQVQIAETRMWEFFRQHLKTPA
jgi:carboxymethylenebutenolidase